MLNLWELTVCEFSLTLTFQSGIYLRFIASLVLCTASEISPSTNDSPLISTKTIIQSMKYYTGMMIKVFVCSRRKLSYKLSLVGLINIALSTHSSTFSLLFSTRHYHTTHKFSVAWCIFFCFFVQTSKPQRV